MTLLWDYLRSDPFVGEYFQQQSVGNAAVYNVRLADAGLERALARLHLRYHAPLDHSAVDQLFDPGKRQRGDES